MPKTIIKKAGLLAVFFMLLTPIYAQNIISGVVTDATTKDPLPGANIVIEGTSTGVITSGDGSYQINVTADSKALLVSFIGYEPKRIALTGQKTINIELSSSSSDLDEVVVIGYGTAKRSDLTGSIATMSSKDLAKLPVANTAEAIKGRLPGVNIITVDGSPDAEIVMRVRGGGSVTQDNSPLLVVDGFIVGSIRDIPSNDIANITVLKDAAATAIYGAQAANGVILITTKEPVSGKTSVSYNGYFQFKELPPNRKFDVLSPYEYVMAQYEYALLQGETDLEEFTKYYGNYEDMDLYKYKNGTDWQEEIFGDPQMSQSHNLSISGGTQNTKLSLSLTNNNDEGLMVGSNYERTVINFKLRHKIWKSLELEASTRITNTVVNGAGTSGGSDLRLRDIITARPVNGVADELDIDLSSVSDDNDYQAFLLAMTDPYELAEQDWRKKTTNNYLLNAGLNWTIIENLTARSAFTFSKKYRETLRYYGPLTNTSQNEGSSLPMGTASYTEDPTYRWLNTINYAFVDLGAHKLDIMLGHEIYSDQGKQHSMTAEEFRESITPEEMFANMTLGTNYAISASEDTPINRVSYFGRVNYSFNEKYLVTATLRGDMSSRFKKSNRLGLFPSVALAWKVSEENFLRNIDFISQLKLRASYGTTGNDQISSTATKFLFKSSTSNGPGMGTNDYNSYYTPSESTLYNPDVKWETTINRNIGLDFQLFKGRLQGNFDLYYNTTKDLLLASAISTSSGFESQWNNIGSTSNKGIELAMTSYIIDKNDFTLSVNLNFGINRSKIEELDGTDTRSYYSNWASTDLKDRDDYYLRVGKTIGLIYGYVTDGMYSTDDFASYDETAEEYTLNDGVADDEDILGISGLRPGYLKLKDLNNDGEITSEDRKVIGNALPDAIGGFGFDITYKGFDLSAFFNWSIGNDLYNTNKIEFNQLYRSDYGNMFNSMRRDNRYTYVNEETGALVTDFDALDELNGDGKEMWSHIGMGAATAVCHSWAIEDGSFLRVQAVTLGYSLPRALISKIRMSQLRIYVTGNNLWIWTKYSGYDPEVSTTRSSSYSALTPGCDFSSYPRSRAITFGVNVTF